MATAVITAFVYESDLEIAERHRHGDAAAFDEIYARFAEMVYNLALRLASDPDEAADLTQEIFLRIYRHLGRFRGGSSLKTWIYRVALNHCRSRLGRRRPPTYSLTPVPGEPPPDVADGRRGPHERAEAGDDAERVAAALGRLATSFREAVVLRDLEGLSYQEIAEVSGVPVGTVRSRIARGRDQLRSMLETSR